MTDRRKSEESWNERPISLVYDLWRGEASGTRIALHQRASIVAKTGDGKKRKILLQR